MQHTDTQADHCIGCRSTRAVYTMRAKGAGEVKRECCGCKRKTYVPAAADVARKVAPSLEACRVWWAHF